MYVNTYIYMCDRIFVSKENGELNMYYYQRIRDLREDADKTQKEIADILGISQQHYCLYEQGTRELPMHHFIKLAKYYRVSLDYIAGLISTPKELER